jgi:hypothetical protein
MVLCSREEETSGFSQERTQQEQSNTTKEKWPMGVTEEQVESVRRLVRRQWSCVPLLDVRRAEKCAEK